jgi:hypothetical protein
MAAIYSNGGNRWNILGFNFTKRDALSSVYKISMVLLHLNISELNKAKFCQHERRQIPDEGLELCLCRFVVIFN